MGGSEVSEGGIGLDCSVGTIVWVRRRNGSWWPGRILGSEELSASHLMSPRSGTPVKLLGREDASVDWYNLEKSKRVKAFRCGEFDACIERAEASQGIPIKKREKYARREDAILHALELEKQQLDMKQKESGSIPNGANNKTSGSWKRDLHHFPSERHMKNDDLKSHGKSANHKSQMPSRKVALPHREDNMGNSLYADKGKNGKQFSEDAPEAMPRMRGLQDFGLMTAPSKRRFSQVVGWETSRKPVENHLQLISNSQNAMEIVGHVGGSKNITPIKRKRSQVGPIEESLVKRRDRRRPLVQVLQSSVKLLDSSSFRPDENAEVTKQAEADPVGAICRAKRSKCVYLPADSGDSLDHLGYPLEQMPVAESQFRMDSLGEEYTSTGLIESSGSDTSETDYLELNAGEDLNPLSDDLPGSNSIRQISYVSGNEISESIGNLNDNEVCLADYSPQLHPTEQITDASKDVGVSKWHMKGKRNIRHVGKKPTDAVDGKVTASSNGLIRQTINDNKGNRSKMRRPESSNQKQLGRDSQPKKEDFSFAYDDVDLLGNGSGHTDAIGFGNRRSPLALKAIKDRGRTHIGFVDSDNDSHVISPSGWDPEGLYGLPQSSYWDESDEHVDPVYTDHVDELLQPMLVEVDLKVQPASYQGEHVPLVSLMSRLNGKAIVGHPIQIEILEDGFTSSLLLRTDGGLDDGTTSQPVWRTARRTAMQRVPRTNPVTALEGDSTELRQIPVREGKTPSKKAYSTHQAKLAKKSISRSRRSSGKLERKLFKKVSLSSQKTRMLSSIATEHKHGGEVIGKKRHRSNDLLGGLLKPEGAVPLVTCVPVKVVFSRIMEAVGRPSFTAHRARMTSSAVRNSSGP
ncbi:Tudor/PWWP/MBT domain-containing protein [Dioscorea alata]|uniref:Tudor/PWWP/MBT domain-containing protein n=2 Tax=Dioscorea alata TaxID=55571 RepID=A0ACB7UFP7_DIOAL|nr:Tudor/PWWP/MBT domain-containing protein [Dioscorea alata]KAH7659026.1 Tudor/PWWP/MBT domain-containing protein [Dioscorea alata]